MHILAMCNLNLLILTNNILLLSMVAFSGYLTLIRFKICLGSIISGMKKYYLLGISDAATNVKFMRMAINVLFAICNILI